MSDGFDTQQVTVVKNYALLSAIFFLTATTLRAQTNPPTGTFWHPTPRNYAVKQLLVALLPTVRNAYKT